MNVAEQLLADLVDWKPHEDLCPLLQRTVELVGPQILATLPIGISMARETLIDHVKTWIDNHVEP